MRKFNFVLLIYLIFCTHVYSQSLSKSVRYILAKSKHFEVYIPQFQGADSIAIRVNRHLEFLYDPLSETLAGKPKRYPFIMQPYTSQANGFVDNVYKRSEFNLRPTQDYQRTGSSNWLDRLTVHEYRHVVQQKHFNQGATRIAYYILGRAGQAGLSALTIPAWFREGDAVEVETEHTTGGRGENSYFTSLFKAHLLQGKFPLSYDQAILGSYTTLVPNHYVVGYLLVNYIYKTYGSHIWNQITERASKRSYLPGALTRATKKYTGKYISVHYDQMNDSLRRTWNIVLPKSKTQKKSRDFLSYSNPVNTSLGNVFVKSSLNNNNKLVLSPSQEPKKEKKLTRVGILTDAGLISSDKFDNLYYLTYFPDKRRTSAISYNSIISYNIASKTRTVLRHKTRIVSVAIDPSGERLLALERQYDLSYILKIISIDSTAKHPSITSDKAQGEKTILKIPPLDQLLTPRWSTDGKSIVAIYSHPTYDEIVQINASTGVIKTLLKATEAWIGHPFLRIKEGEEQLFFASNAFGNSRIFMKNIKTNKIYQLSKNTISDRSPIYDESQNRVVYITLTNQGDLPQYISNFDGLKEVKFSNTAISPMLSESKELLTFDQIPDDFMRKKGDIKSTIIKSNIKGIRPYQWGLYADNSNFTYLGVNFADKLNYVRLKLGYFFALDNPNKRYEVKLEYDGFNLGNLNLIASRNDYETTFLTRADNNSIVEIIPKETRSNYNIDLGLTIPLWLRRTHYYSNLSIRPAIAFQTSFNTTPLGNYLRPTYNRIAYANVVSFALYRPRHTRALNPRLGFNISITTQLSQYSFVPVEAVPRIPATPAERPNGLQLNHSFTGQFYLPGVFRNDNFIITQRYSEFNDARISVDFSRQGAIFYDSNKNTLFRISYYLPLVYPDITLYSLLNIKRFSLVLTREISTNLENNITSGNYQIGLWTDINILRIPQELRFTATYRIQDNYVGQWLFSFNIFNFTGTR